MAESTCRTPLIVALDFSEGDAALALADQLDPTLTRVKVGKQLFTQAGPSLVRELVARRFDVFLDLKFHDIPNTVAGAVRAAAALGVWMVNVHASGGRRMMQAAVEALADLEQRPLLTAVTVLTSMEAADLADLGVTRSPEAQVLLLAQLAAACGVDGVVCAASEAALIRDAVGDAFLRVTPGIRLAGDPQHDQRRVLTPEAALAAGATHLVIGRSITAAADPGGVLAQLAKFLSHPQVAS